MNIVYELSNSKWDGRIHRSISVMWVEDMDTDKYVR